MYDEFYSFEEKRNLKIRKQQTKEVKQRVLLVDQKHAFVFDYIVTLHQSTSIDIPKITDYARRLSRVSLTSLSGAAEGYQNLLGSPENALRNLQDFPSQLFSKNSGEPLEFSAEYLEFSKIVGLSYRRLYYTEGGPDFSRINFYEGEFHGLCSQAKSLAPASLGQAP